MPQEALTPFGSAADACLETVIQRVLEGLKQRHLLPPETLAHYVLGAPAVGEGWVGREGEVWVPYEAPQLFFLLPPGFEVEAIAAEAASDPELEAICMESGYAAQLEWATELSLAAPPQAFLATLVLTRRRLLWSFGKSDPLSRASIPTHPSLAARQLFLNQATRLQELAAWSQQEIFGLHPGIVRLAFIRALEVLTDLGEVVLILNGCQAPEFGARSSFMTTLAENGQVHDTLAQLYRTAVTLRTRQPSPRIPDWDTLRDLLAEVPVWARHVAHVHLGAEIVDPVA